MRLVTRNFNRPTFLPTLWNEFFADDHFTKRPTGKNCTINYNNYGTRPAVNIKKEEEAYILEVAAPGFDKTDFSVELDKGILTIAGKKETAAEKEGGYTRREFTHKAFKRSFTVAEDTIAVEDIRATYEAGILLVTLPKKAVEDTKVNIDIS